MKNKKQQIVFLEPFPEVMFYKLARAFKKRGYETISIRLLEFDKDSEVFYKDAFDKIISFDLSFVKMKDPKFFLSILKKTPTVLKNYLKLFSLKPKIVISRATPSTPTFLFRKFFRKWPILYFPYDIRGLTYPDKISAKRNGLTNFEIYSERYCLENCKGLMHKGDPKELDYLDGRMLGRNIQFTPALSFSTYCSNEFIVPMKKGKKLGKEIHTVYIGSMGSSTTGTGYLFEHFNKIIKQKIHIHVYMKSNTLSTDKGFEKMSKAAKELSDSKYFHIHPPLDPKGIIKEISKYDFGIWLYDHLSKTNKKSLEPRFAIGNKFASYLEAGIPFIYSKEFGFIDKLMRKYKLGNLGINKVEEFEKTIKTINYPITLKKVKKAREDFNMDKNISRLEKFIDTITKR